MNRPLFFNIFQGFSLRHKKSALTLAVDQKNRWQSLSQLIIKGTFQHGKKTSKFLIIWFIFHDFSALTDSKNIFRFGGKITVLTSQNLKSENFKRLENEVYLS